MKVTVNGVEQKEYKYPVSVAGIDMICCDKPDVAERQYAFPMTDVDTDMNSDMSVLSSGHTADVKQTSLDSPHKILI